MTLPPRAGRALTLVIALGLAGAGCARGNAEQATAATRAACRRHADEVFGMRNPDALYRSDAQATAIGSPFAGTGIAGGIGAGLSDEYTRDKLYDNCLRGGGGTVGAAPEAPAPTEAPASTQTSAPAQP